MTEVTLITGAASGLGWAMAQAWFARGHRLVLVDMNGELLASRCEQLAAPERVMSQVLDLTDSDALKTLVTSVEQRFGRLDTLVNNAGITQRSLAAKTDPAVFRRVMAVDWQAPLELALASLPLLRKGRGSIINIGSMAGWMPVLGRTGYCAAKSALAQSFEVMRAELANDGIHVLMVYPSFLDTPIEQNALGHDGQPARHARSTAGAMRSADWMAGRIVAAHAQRKARLFPDRFSALASILWRVWPSLYLRLMTRRFASELDQ